MHGYARLTKPGKLTVHAAYSSTAGERGGEDARMASTTQLVVQGDRAAGMTTRFRREAKMVRLEEPGMAAAAAAPPISGGNTTSWFAMAHALCSRHAPSAA